MLEFSKISPGHFCFFVTWPCSSAWPCPCALWPLCPLLSPWPWSCTESAPDLRSFDTAQTVKIDLHRFIIMKVSATHVYSYSKSTPQNIPSSLSSFHSAWLIFYCSVIGLLWTCQVSTCFNMSLGSPTQPAFNSSIHTLWPPLHCTPTPRCSWRHALRRGHHALHLLPMPPRSPEMTPRHDGWWIVLEILTWLVMICQWLASLPRI